jgi:hypothetical protein
MMSKISGGQQITSSSWNAAAATAGTPVQGMSALMGIFPSS